MTTTITVKLGNAAGEVVDREAEPFWQVNGLALHEAVGNCDALTLTHVPSGRAVFPNVDWEQTLVVLCALEIAELWDWDRTKDDLEADPDYPEMQQRVRSIYWAYATPPKLADGEA